MENTTNERSTSPIEAALITGGAGSGKTQRLIERAMTLASASDEASVLAFCATPLAVRTFATRLVKFAGEDVARRVRVTTPRSFALDVLSTDVARTATGREPRMLTHVEETFLMEDMKVSGTRPKRLREMLKFFFRSFTELADDEQGKWLVTTEEEQICSLLKANLAFVQGYLECEVAAAAYRLLRDNGNLWAQFAVDHVLADDYQLLSRASQKLVCLAAAHSLTVAGDKLACVEAYDSYPYAEGIAEFAEEFPQAERTILDGCHRPRGSEVVAAESPADEMQEVAHLVASVIAQGASPADIAIAAPNATWARNAGAALAAAGVSCENPFALQRIARGDVRNAKRCANARMLSLLDLAADPANAAAWRSWCGYGDYLVRSGAFSALRTYAEKRGLTLPEALERACSEQTDAQDELGTHALGIGQVLRAFRAAKEKIAELNAAAKPLSGKALLDDLAEFTTDGQLQKVPPEIAKACLVSPEERTGSEGEGEVEGDPNSARAMADRARKALLEPRCENPDAVLVVPYDSVAGLSPRMLVVTGFVNGFIPSRDYFDATVSPIEKQEKMHALDTRRVYTLASAPRKRLVVSYFTSIDLENAEALRLKISRIRLKDGRRTCTISPSDFLQTVTEP